MACANCPGASRWRKACNKAWVCVPRFIHLLEYPAVELKLWFVQCGNIRRQVMGSKLHTRALLVERGSRTGIQA